MIDLKTHLEKSGVSNDKIKLIVLISELSKKISKAFIRQQHQLSSKNIHGELQMALDKYADSVLIEELENSKLVKTVASEEQADIIEIIKAEGKFGVTIDPLDGSSLIDVNLAVGTIIGIFDEGDVLEKGNKMDAAMYLIYGPLTTLVYTAKKGVHEFVLDSDGSFILQKENIIIPEGKIIAPGALRKDYLPNHEKYIKELESKGFKLRYSGSFVADLNQILHKGGVFTYPADKEHPQGKLRLLFEANPLGFIITQAGGYISNGHENILNIKPQSISQRIPLYIGSKKTVELIEKINRENSQNK